MTKEKQNKDKLSVESLADSIQKKQKRSRTASFFKSALFRKLKSITSVPKSFCTDFKLFSVMLSSVSNINTIYSNRVSISATASLFEINTIT